MWDLPGLGIEPMSPPLAGGFLTTAPPGKSLNCILKMVKIVKICYVYFTTVKIKEIPLKNEDLSLGQQWDVGKGWWTPLVSLSPDDTIPYNYMTGYCFLSVPMDSYLVCILPPNIHKATSPLSFGFHSF